MSVMRSPIFEASAAVSSDSARMPVPVAPSASTRRRMGSPAMVPPSRKWVMDHQRASEVLGNCASPGCEVSASTAKAEMRMAVSSSSTATCTSGG